MNKNINPVGAHLSIASGYLAAFKEAVSIGADAIQVFAKSPMQSRLRSLSDEDAASVLASPEIKLVRSFVIHASYLINFAKPMDVDSFQIKSLAEDVWSADKVSGAGAVVHMGKSLTIDKREAIGNFVENIKRVVRETDGAKAGVILENTAGQGSEFGFELEELGGIYKKIGDTKRVKICLDTAHLFGAGYDLHDARKATDVVAKIEKFLGIENVACVHLNDSKKPVGSRVDRHEDVGFGTIGEDGLISFVKSLRKYGGGNIPLILETPETSRSYHTQIESMRSHFA